MASIGRAPATVNGGFIEADLLRNKFNAFKDEISGQQLADAITGTANNCNSVELLESGADLAATIAKLNELITALRR